MKKFIFSIIVGLFAISAVACAKPNFGNESGNYPQRTISFVAPSGAGGGWDQTARSITKVLQTSKLVKQPMMVENKPGGGGAVFMAEYATQFTKDNYKLLLNSPPIIINHLKKEGNSPYGYQDTTPLAQLTKDYGVYVVKADSPIKDLPSMIKELKKNPKKYSFAGGSAPGSMDHLVSILPAYLSGIKPKDIKYISYDGGGEAMTALLGNNADVIATDASSVSEYVKSNKVRVLGVTAPKRLDGALKNVPTLKELGMKKGEFNIWRGIFGPKEMEPSAKKYWQTKLKTLSKNPQWKKELKAKGWESDYKDADEFSAYLKEQSKQVKTLLKAVGMNK
ncbi:putative tricarboxylic transport membrane protein [Marininema mesophilum]|uniref:Putative tricarboxylic transport membrane protein n=1 Tax=Marininema mesophilum TaxID=1048340 RepID=A0A1H2YKQ3_9BACL|nr:tripartite tricarboxylate transporter substrate binding protein [Marininema mesophilum]SDX05757.1 putative tricarboxylic transport membrane protein [Marininema mesophilum]